MVVLLISGWVSSSRKGHLSPRGPGGPGRIIGMVGRKKNLDRWSEKQEVKNEI
jgi:hypothetical protein